MVKAVPPQADDFIGTVRLQEDLLIPYRIRTVRVGVEATVLVLVALVAFSFWPGHGKLDYFAYQTILLIAAVGVLFVSLLPWRRLFQRGLGMAFMYAWSVMDVGLITALVAATGGWESSLWILFMLTTVFSAASYPPRAQAGLLALTFLCYLAVDYLTGWGLPDAFVLVNLVTLGGVAFIGGFLSQELMKQMGAHESERAESERRAGIMAEVAKSGRTISSLDSAKVLDAVVQAAIEVGFEVSNIGVFDHKEKTYRIVHERGLPPEYARGIHPTDSGAHGLVYKKRSTVVVENYDQSEFAMEELRAAGHKTVVSVPIWVQGELTAVLSAALKVKRPIFSYEVEALEILAGQAGRALEVARRFEEERRTVERLAELDRLKSDFLSTVSHEIRTPLTVIEGMGVTLQERGDTLDEAVRSELLSRLNANARALDRIIANLLEFTRMETGKLTLRVEPIEIADLLRKAVSRLNPLFAEHELALDLDENVKVRADTVLIERVIENLLSNAAKYTPAATRITVSAKTDGDEVEVAVEDEGPGISKAEARHLGERFFRGGDPTTRSTKGMGLGLALANEILELHGSRLEIESHLGRGSRFSFKLPVAEAVRTRRAAVS